jgi:hypothetical protein
MDLKPGQTKNIPPSRGNASSASVPSARYVGLRTSLTRVSRRPMPPFHLHCQQGCSEVSKVALRVIYSGLE